jgi:hypothetical protein
MRIRQVVDQEEGLAPLKNFLRKNLKMKTKVKIFIA